MTLAALAALALGVEGTWYAQRLPFVGPMGQVLLRGPGGGAGVGASLLLEQGGDDAVLLVEGLGMIVLPTDPAYGLYSLGGGIGWLRWEDPRGEDQGVWTRTYQYWVFMTEQRVGAVWWFMKAKVLPRQTWLPFLISVGIRF